MVRRGSSASTASGTEPFAAGCPIGGHLGISVPSPNRELLKGAEECTSMSIQKNTVVAVRAEWSTSSPSPPSSRWSSSVPSSRIGSRDVGVPQEEKARTKVEDPSL